MTIRASRKFSSHFNSVAGEEILAFVDPAESAFAHGLALVPFMVQISSELEGGERDVRFETTNGIFPLSNDSSRVQIVRADAAGDGYSLPAQSRAGGGKRWCGQLL
jgi:hypothetical protein